jgi:hypothetical protein
VWDGKENEGDEGVCADVAIIVDAIGDEKGGLWRRHPRRPSMSPTARQAAEDP